MFVYAFYIFETFCHALSNLLLLNQALKRFAINHWFKHFFSASVPKDNVNAYFSFSLSCLEKPSRKNRFELRQLFAFKEKEFMHLMAHT
jgi:hypothetical protein